MKTETASKIDPQRVEKIFIDCLFRDGEDTSKHIKAEGISCNVGFHPERITRHKQEISALLDELPDEFKKSGGGGMSFLKACDDREGNQWTGLHKRMEQLIQLGIGIGKVECLMPRTMWATLPGGMPYYLVK